MSSLARQFQSFLVNSLGPVHSGSVEGARNVELQGGIPQGIRLAHTLLSNCRRSLKLVELLLRFAYQAGRNSALPIVYSARLSHFSACRLKQFGRKIRQRSIG
jgi:hypothetical protein